MLYKCAILTYLLTSDAIKRIFTNFKKIRKILEFLRILNTEVTNFQSMSLSVVKNSVFVDRFKIKVRLDSGTPPVDLWRRAVRCG